MTGERTEEEISIKIDDKQNKKVEREREREREGERGKETGGGSEQSSIIRPLAHERVARWRPGPSFGDGLCLIFKDRFLIRFPPNFQERLLMFSASTEFVFWGPMKKTVSTDILAGFTFNNRVLRLPAIVLLNTTFRPENSGLLRVYWHDVSARKLGPSSGIPEEGPSFRVETSCSIKRLLEDEALCCWKTVSFYTSLSRWGKRTQKIWISPFN